MANGDSTFSSRDIVRIFERHLTASERLEVLEYFESNISPNVRVRRAIGTILSEGPGFLDSAQEVTQFFQGIVDKVNQAISEDIQTALSDMNTFTSNLIEDVDLAMHQMNEAKQNAPILAPLIDPLLTQLRDIRTFLRFIRPLTTIPQALIDADDAVNSVQVRIDDLRYAISIIESYLRG